MMESNLFEIEQLLDARDFEKSGAELHTMLVNFRRGLHFSPATDAHKIEPTLMSSYTRFSTCLIRQFYDYMDYKLTPHTFGLWLVYSREIRAIFSIGGFYGTDFIMAAFNERFKYAIEKKDNSAIEQLGFRLLLFGMLENIFNIDFDVFHKIFPDATAAAVLSLLSSTAVLTARGSSIKEQLSDLSIFKNYKIKDDKEFLDITAVWMLCSYLTRRDKHLIKNDLNNIIKKWVDKNVKFGSKCKKYDPTTEKPKMIVVLEFFHETHSMRRSYNKALESLKGRFELIGLSLQNNEAADCEGNIFDSMINLECGKDGRLVDPKLLTFGVNRILQMKPDIIFYPSLGMHYIAIILANMRLAPIQIMSFGHPASSFCNTIDYGIIEEDYAPEAADLFTEKLITIPAESFVSDPVPHLYKPLLKNKGKEDTLLIAIPGVLSKISAKFLQTCRIINELSKRKIEFMFFLNDTELFYLQCKKEILDKIPNSHVFHRLPPNIYMQHLEYCDLYLSTFPFGGANSVIDAMCVGLPVVCLRGEDIAGRTDSALIQRRGLPDWFIASSEEEYIAAALRLIHNDEERIRLHHEILEKSVELFSDNNTNYSKNSKCFSDVLWYVFQNHGKIH